MDKIIKIYKAIKLKSIVYEAGDIDATINCEIVYKHKAISSRLVISHSDLNRLISKMENQEEDWVEQNKEILYLEDGSQLIEYNFNSKMNTTIHNFHFNKSYAQIGA